VEGVNLLKRIHLAGVWITLCLLAVSCGGNGKATTTTTTTTTPSTALQFTSPSSAPIIDAGQSLSITANQPVTWSLESLFGVPPGCFSSATTGCVTTIQTASATVTYTAPSSTSNVSFPTQVSIVATSASDSTATAILPVFINPQVTIAGSLLLSTNIDCSAIPVIPLSTAGTVGLPYSQGNLLIQGGTPPYTWSIIAGAPPIGLSLGTATRTNSGTNTTYQAFLYGTPSSVGCSQIQLQVTDGAGAVAKSAIYNVLITPPPLKVQAPNYTDMYAGVAYPPTAFTVSNGTPPYTWTVTSPLPANLTLTAPPQNTAAAYISGTPVSLQSSPPTLTVTDSELPYAAIGTVTLNQNPNSPSGLPVLQSPCTPFISNGVSESTFNSTMLGTYAFLLHGFDANGPVVIAGSFTADGNGDGGAATPTGTGVEDIMRTTGSQANVPVTASYSVFQQESDLSPGTVRSVGCVTITDTGTGTTNTFALSLGGCSGKSDPASGECLANGGVEGVFTTGRMIEFDSTGTRVSGILRLQDTSAFSAGLSGPYAFGLSGWDSSGHTPIRYAAAGSVSASSGTLSSAAADINDGGTLQSSLTGGTGSSTINSTTGVQNGRGTSTLTVGSASFNLAFYVVSANEVILAATGSPSAANPVVSGEAIATTGSFSALSLQNTHMFHTTGVASAAPDANIGILSFDGISAVSGTQYEDQAGTLGSTSLSGSYTVDGTTGRFVFFPSLTNSQSLGDHPLVGYAIPVPNTLTRQGCIILANCVTGFLVSTDQSAQAGLMEFQTPATAPPPPFSDLYVTGYYFYGTDEALDSATPLINGASAANPNGNQYGGVESVNYSLNSFYCVQEPGCTLLQPNLAISPFASGSDNGTYSVNSNGTGTVGGETVAVTNGNVIFYIDESPINAHPSLVVVEQ
jgi:hypothetical protein